MRRSRRTLGNRLPAQHVSQSPMALTTQHRPVPPEETRLWAIVPCKGRLEFLQQTAPLLIFQPHLHVCLVDYSCPQGAGDWLEGSFPDQVKEGRVVVERVVGYSGFNKCRAHNAGARRAIREGANALCFIDADTLVEPGFSDFVLRNISFNRFLIAGLRDDGTDMPSMTGLLVVHPSHFLRVGGFDERFEGWGGEDVELRLRLFCLGGLDYRDVPLSLVRPIPHSNALRTQFYRQSSIGVSNRDNMAHIRRKIASEWHGQCVRPLSAARRLWYRGRQGEVFATDEIARNLLGSRHPKRNAVRRMVSRRSARGIIAVSARGRGG